MIGIIAPIIKAVYKAISTINIVRCTESIDSGIE